METTEVKLDPFARLTSLTFWSPWREW